MNLRRLAIALAVGAAAGLAIYVLSVVILVFHSILSLAFLAVFAGIGIVLALIFDALGPVE